YQPIPYSYFDLHSEVFGQAQCHGNLLVNEISVINDHTKALVRPLTGNVILNIDATKAAETTQSLSEADCGGNQGDNCVILSPDLTHVDKEDSSNLAQSLYWQNQLDRFEPLNFEQFLGTHNSAVSPYYTHSNSDYNLSYGDPDNYATITEQLNSGFRQIELDIEWDQNNIIECHDHVSSSIQGILCAGNDGLIGSDPNTHYPLVEIKNWLTQHPHQLIILFLDVNLPLTNHIKELDQTLAYLEPYIFTPQLAQQYFSVAGNTLPAYLLSTDSLTEQFHKNIIIVATSDIADMQTSRYVFTRVLKSKLEPLAEKSVHDFLSNGIACSGLAKYSAIVPFFENTHTNLIRINGDRTVLGYISSVGNQSPDSYNDYFTPFNIANLQSCPVNILSMNMLGYTCDSNQCQFHPTDPRLATVLWSWQLGYPLQKNGATIAYIDPKDKRFKNDPLQIGQSYSVLCYQKPLTPLTEPTQSLMWFIVANMTVDNLNTVSQTAMQLCQQRGGIFATPTTRYQFDDMLTMLGNVTQPLLLNYQYDKSSKKWIANSGHSL
ncbi:MAG: hypothetical protein KIT27_09110, partial [Legionellales bacterium]|nr:hypothetical protein [Legionellales bacterium]